MRLRLLITMAIATLVLGFGVMAPACGEEEEATVTEETVTEEEEEEEEAEEGAPSSLVEYFEELDGLNSRLNEDVAELDAAFQEAAAGATSEEEQIEATIDYANALLALIGDGVEELEDIDPPEEVEDEHETFLAAAQELLEVLEDFAEAVEDAQSAEDVLNAVAGFEGAATEAGTEFDEACFALQDIADENNIAVDLECEEE